MADIIIWLKYLFQGGYHLSNCQRLQWSNQSAWLNFIHFSVLNSQTQAFSTMKATHKQKWLAHTHPEARLQWLQFCSPPADDQFSVFPPSGPFCLGSPWISLSFHHSLMSSCSCQHLLTASNSLQHTGSWDPCDELQSAVCRGGFTLRRANQGKHPLPRGRVSTDRLSPSYPVITLPLPLCCKLLHLNPVSRGTDTLVITFQSV